MLAAFNLKKWIDENRNLLKPPVGNQVVWGDAGEFLVMVVGGPNSRTDYHIDESEEFLYQLEGDMTLKLIENGKPRDLVIREGDVFLLPARVPHSPRRPAGTIGLVIERKRRPGELDGFQWWCESCGEKLYEEFIAVKNIVTDLPALFDRFFNDPGKSTCRGCKTPARRG